MQVNVNEASPSPSQQHQGKEHGRELRKLFVGPPGCGKGTQAAHLQDTYKCHHLSTGDMLREAVNNGTESGIEAKMMFTRSISA